MNRKVIGWIAAAAVAVGLSAVAFVYFAGGSGEPSTDLTTPAIADADTTTTPAAVATTGGHQVVVFVIDATQSVASFEIDEVLRGADNRVVGTTGEVAGQVSVDLTDLGSAQFSEIVVNARTFATDSGFRDRAIRGPVILDAANDAFELITFAASSVDGLSGPAEVGQTVEFTVAGDLTIKGTTNPAVFEVTATLADEATIIGSASATVMRSDFGIDIPTVPGVADVSEEVLIRLDFTASSA